MLNPMRVFLAFCAAVAVFAQQPAPQSPATDQANQQASDVPAKRQRALQLINQGQYLSALPLFEELARANPNDATVQVGLATCLFEKSGVETDAAQASALRQRAKEVAEYARRLGRQDAVLDVILQAGASGNANSVQAESPDPEVQKTLREAEVAFGKGDYAAALAAYKHALELDPKLYTAAVYAGDTCFRTRDLNCASEWFQKAVLIDPNQDTAYRYWGDALMQAGKNDEARDKYVEAVIAQPYNRMTWRTLANWAKRNGATLNPPQIQRPALGNDPHNITVPGDLAKDTDTGRSAWITYIIGHSAWRNAIFAKTHPAEKEYRHSLDEETATLQAVVNLLKKTPPKNLDAQLALLMKLQDDGMLQPWILFQGADAGIAKDYATYRDAHRDLLRKYIDEYVIKAA